MITEASVLTGLATGLLVLRHRISRRPLIGIAGAFVAINLLSTWIGFTYYNPDTEGASIRINIPFDALGDILWQSNLLTFAFAGGAFLGSLLRPTPSSNLAHTNTSQLQLLVQQVSAGFLTGVALVVLLVFIYGNGASGLLHRNEYMIEVSQVAKSVGAIFTLCALFAIGLRSQSAATTFVERVNLSAVATFTVLTYGAYSSRMFAIGALILGFGMYIGSSAAHRALFPMLAAVASPFLLHLMLVMRGEYEQGLIPLIQMAFTAQAWEDLSFEVLLNNTITTNFAITALSALHGNIDLPYLLTSINPLPGFLTDWYTLNTGLNVSTPYSAIGEWLAFDLVGGIAFFAALGLIYDDLDQRIDSGSTIAALMGSAFFVLAAVTMLQYNTRSAIRFIYYFYFIYAAIKFMNLAFRGLKTGVAARHE